MHSFQRFTEGSQRVLTMAQEEAERSRHSYIGTEHLLFGLLRERQGLGARALSNLGVEINEVRPTIESMLARDEGIIIRQIVPTSRVKRVIELSFEVASRMGSDSVGTEHLLLGLVTEGDGLAAHVLVDLGANERAVRQELDRMLTEPGWLEKTVARMGADQAAAEDTTRGSQARDRASSEIIDAAIEEARLLGDTDITEEHFLLALLARQSGPAFEILREANLSAAEVRRRIQGKRERGSTKPGRDSG